ncbi:MAG TPA: uroporphyrinogen decarboxylase family protein [Anaerolineae bacterium]|nr:uroporphyrinogen decarboxylase family protein [Anaerolineae bacterium]HOQ97924.1 uroporphyrinogen decarboxylase family protein [Anaerolineae bacterium]
MNSRERVLVALNHQEPDRVPLDLGGGPTSGMHVSSVYLLRQALQLDPPGTPVRVIEPFQMLGEIAPDLLAAVGADVVPLAAPRTLFGYRNEGWRPWTLWDGTPVLVPEGFNTEVEPDGSIVQYPEGDRTAPPSGRMPADGYYFDPIIRQPPIDEARLDPEDNVEEFGPLSADDLAYYRAEAERLWTQTDRAILANWGGTAFGDISLVPATWLKHPKGIRDMAEWYMSTVMRQDYVRRVFERQCEIALENLPRLYEAVGDRVAAVYVSGADFGMQTGPFISPQMYRRLYLPFQKAINDWIHRHTPWKTFIHTCGAVTALLPDIIEAGFDVFNPVQTSAAGMDPAALKARFGDRLVFWGGGVDTQRTLPFGTPGEVRAEVHERMRTFGPGGGFVFNTVHNVQAQVPIENVLALYEAVRAYGTYPVS